MSGRLWLADNGVRELKQTLSTTERRIPDWFPMPDDIPSPVTCDECGSEVSVTEVVTPWPGEWQDRYCPDCWSSVQEEP